MTDDVVRVLIADDHSMFRRGVRSLLSTVEGVEVVAEASDGESAVALAAELSPDLVLMDLQMPGGGGLAAIRAVTEQCPDTNVLVVTMFEDDDSVFAAMRAGARGYVLKDMDADDPQAAGRGPVPGDRRRPRGGPGASLARLAGSAVPRSRDRVPLDRGTGTPRG